MKCKDCGRSFTPKCEKCGKPGAEGRELCEKHLRKMRKVNEWLITKRLPDDEIPARARAVADTLYAESDKIADGRWPPVVELCRGCRADAAFRGPFGAPSGQRGTSSERRRMTRDELNNIEIDAARRGWRPGGINRDG